MALPASNNKAVVLFSGGQDSTTCLFWAKQQFDEVVAFNILYNQKHIIESTQALKIAEIAQVPLVQQIIPDNFFGNTSSLVNPQIELEANGYKIDGQLPSTFVPGRNLVFLNLVAIWAYNNKVNNIVTGVCEADYSGYPDCRGEFIQSAEQTLQLAMDYPFKIHTPLLKLTKAEIWNFANTLDCLKIIQEQSHTCYNGERNRLHDWGYGCGYCAACILRANGWQKFKEQQLN